MVTALILYWPYIFFLTHIRHVPPWVLRAGVSDKTLHYLGYFILAFLLWSAVKPENRVNWRSGAAWWVLTAAVLYAALDEYLQGYFGRDTDIMDFAADMAGVFTGLFVQTLFFFWPAALILTGTCIFVLTNFTRTDIYGLLPVTSTMFGFLAYALLTLLWIRCMRDFLKAGFPQWRWFVAAPALPVGFLIAVELFAHATDGGFLPMRIKICAAGIVAALTLAASAKVVVWKGRTHGRSD